jgi:hypothetical protein
MPRGPNKVLIARHVIGRSARQQEISIFINILSTRLALTQRARKLFLALFSATNTSARASQGAARVLEINQSLPALSQALFTSLFPSLSFAWTSFSPHSSDDSASLRSSGFFLLGDALCCYVSLVIKMLYDHVLFFHIIIVIVIASLASFRPFFRLFLRTKMCVEEEFFRGTKKRRNLRLRRGVCRFVSER